jgi:thioredoxin reductase (NADPH)
VEGPKYYRKVTDAFGLRVTLGQEVVGLRRLEASGESARFSVETRSADGAPSSRAARNVAFATGYYDHPNLLGIPGEERAHVSHYYTEPHGYYRQPVVVVGGKNSAAIAALELYRAGAEVTLVHRRAQLSDSIKYWIRPDIENRIKEGAIPALFETCVTEIRAHSVVVASAAGGQEIPAEQVFLLTGYHPDTGLLRQAGVRIDERRWCPARGYAGDERPRPGRRARSGKQTPHLHREAVSTGRRSWAITGRAVSAR